MTLYLLATSPRLPAGLLTGQAWDLLRTHPVYAPSGSALTDVLKSAGVDVSIEPEQRLLVERAREESLVWLAGGDPEAARQFAMDVVRHAPRPTIEVVYGSWDPPGARLLDVVEVLDRLRSPGGCPWDAEQTHKSLMPSLLEEAYEAYDALKEGDPVHMREELGDVLIQVVFHARLAEELPEGERWNIDDVAAVLVEKLVSRHPHVFAGGHAESAEEVRQNWEEIKRDEKKRKSALDGVARSAPALALVAKYLDKAEGYGLSISTPSLPESVRVPGDGEELGDLLTAIVAEARRHGLDAEAALREAAHRLAGRIRAAEEER